MDPELILQYMLMAGGQAGLDAPSLAQMGTMQGRGKIPQRKPLSFDDLYDPYMQRVDKAYDMPSATQEYGLQHGGGGTRYGGAGPDRGKFLEGLTHQRATAHEQIADIFNQLTQGEDPSVVAARKRAFLERLQGNPNDPQQIGSDARLAIEDLLGVIQRRSGEYNSPQNQPQAPQYDMGPAVQQYGNWLAAKGIDPTPYVQTGMLQSRASQAAQQYQQIRARNKTPIVTGYET